MSTLDDVISKINKLRELAKSNNPHEAEAAATAANALLAKHQLSEMDLQLKGHRNPESIEVISDHLYESGRVMLWIHNLAKVLCDAYGCTYWVETIFDPLKISASNPKARRATFKAFKVVGRRSDFDIVKYMFTWLQPEIERLTKANAYGRGMTYAQSYALGLVEGINRQFDSQKESLKQEAQALGQSQALMCLDSRVYDSVKVMESFFKTNKYKVGKSYSSQSMTGNAFARGLERGKDIHLSQGLNGSPASKGLK